MSPVHEHDCDACTFVQSVPLIHPYRDGDGHRTGVCGAEVTHGDLWLACDGSSYKWIVRYGRWGEYATTNDPGHYLKLPFVAHESAQDREDRKWRAEMAELDRLIAEEARGC